MDGFPWLQFAGLLLTGMTVLAGVWWKLQAQIVTVKDDLAAFKLTAAEKYATNAAIKEVEDRIVGAIDRLGDRLDKFIDNRNRA